MSRAEIKKILEKQLQLLSEKSEQVKNEHDAPSQLMTLTQAMATAVSAMARFEEASGYQYA